jgi:hypothetical protein
VILGGFFLYSSVVDRHRFYADPDPNPTFHFDADPDPNPTFHFDADPDPDWHQNSRCRSTFGS